MVKPPFNDIDAIFISHAHEDHFSARDLENYLTRIPLGHFFTPQQAIDAIKNKRNFKGRLFAFALYIGAAPQSKTVDGLTVTAVRPPMLDGLRVKT
jgi:mRNA degradation ribonuclease J1/J2